jgi:hypothetical protein
MAEFIDLTGQKFRKLTVIKRVNPPEHVKVKCVYWLCKCECGNETIIAGGSLKNEKVISCGCYNKENASKIHLNDLTGRKFGRWTVIKREDNDKAGSSRWLCRCDCGKEKVVRGSELNKGSSKSCGCYHKEKLSKRSLDDLEGKRFGRWVVIKREKKSSEYRKVYWLCKCDCGNEKVVSSDALRYGDSISCGCYKKEMSIKRRGNKEDLTGKRFGRLIVIRKSEPGEYKNKKELFWLCKCNCGNEKFIRDNDLKRGYTSSCGCYNREKNMLDNCQGAKNRILQGYKARAKRKELEFSLNKDRFFEMIEKDCAYCGSKPSNFQRGNGMAGDFLYNGIDRKNPSLGYIENNVATCCWTCNQAKNNLTEDEFLKQTERIYNYRIKK